MTDLSPLPPLPQDPTNPYVAPMLADMQAQAQQAPTPPSNPFVGRMMAELDTATKEREQHFAASYRAALRTDPAMFAEAKAIAKQLGEDVSPDAVLGNLKVAREQVKARAIRYEELRRRSPILAEQVGKADFVRIARDDIDNLETTESTFGWLKRNVQAGQAANMRGYIGTRKALGISTPQEEDALLQLEQLQKEANMDAGVAGNVAQTIGQMADTVPTALAIGGAAAAPMAALGPAAPLAAPTTFTVASGAALFTQSAMIEGGNAYLDMVDNGYDHQTAAAVALGIGLVNGSLELAGAKMVAKPFQAVFAKEAVSALSKAMTRETAARAFGVFVRDYAKSLGAEVFTETMQEAVSIAGEDFARRISRPDKAEMTSGQVMERLGDIFTKTTMSMGVLSVPGPAMRYAADSMRAGQASQQARAFDELAKVAGESQVRKLDGEGYSGAVGAMAEASGAPLIYVDAKALGDILRQQDKAAVEAGNGRTKSAASQLDEKLPGLSEQLAEAEREGGDVVIRTDDWASKLAGTELDAILRPHMRFDPEGISLSQAEETRASLKEMRAGLQGEQAMGTEAERAFAESAEKVRQTLETDIGKALTEAKAVGVSKVEQQGAARIAAEMAATLAEGSGKTPEELFQQYRPAFMAGTVAEQGQTLQQFAGAGSMTANQEAAGQAFRRLEAGEDPEVVRRETGWFRGDEGRMRYEISDSDAKFLWRDRLTSYRFGNALASFRRDSSFVPLGELIQHEALFRAYPQLRDVRVVAEPMDGTSRGYLQQTKDVTRIAVSDAVDGYGALAVLMHEIQHAIQNIEGFAQGSSGSDLAYRQSAGEVEARNTAERLPMSDEQRLQYSPEQTRDVPRAEVVVKISGKTYATAMPTGDILRQPARGEFGRSRLAILFGEKADASTVLHELTHWYTEVLLRMGLAGNVPPAIQTQLDALLARWGVADVAAWNALSTKEQAAKLEDIAYNAEEYFATGQAPSKELAGLFAKLRTWITRIYRAVRDTLNAAYRRETGQDLPALTPELRQFFDRMLASQQAIELAQAEQGIVPLFFDEKARKAAGITDEQWSDLQEYDRAVKDEAVATLTAKALRGLELFENSRSKALRDLARQAREKRQGFREEAEKQVALRPVYRAIRMLRDGVYVALDGTTEAIPEGERLRMDAKAVRRILGVEEQVAKSQTLLSRIREMGGINPRGYPGEKGADMRRLLPGLFNRKGMEWEQLAQALEADGFGPERPGRRDGTTTEAADYSWLHDAVDDAGGGLDTFRRDDAAQMQAQGPQSDELTRARDKAKQEYRRLVAIRVVQAESGMAPDMVAEMFGFTSGDAMLAEMASARSFAEEVGAVVDERMDREVGLTDPKRLRAALAEALHGTGRAKLIAAELRHLLKTTQSTASMVAAAKEAARQKLLTMEVGRISPRAFVQAEFRAGKRAREALASGNIQEAIEAQRQYLLQHQLTRLSLDIEKEVDKFLQTVDDRYFADDEKVIKGRNLDIVQAARSILGMHGLAGGRTFEKVLAYLRVLKQQNPELHAELEDLATDATVDAKDYRSTTLEQFRVMVNAVESLWDRAKRSQEIEINGRLVSKAMARDELLAAALKRYGKAKPVSPSTESARRAARFSTGPALLRRVEHFTSWLDGGTDGPWTRYIWQPMRKRFDAYMASREQRIKALRDIIKGLDLSTEKIDAPELGTQTFNGMAELLGAMLHMGNASNLQKLLGGYAWGATLGDGTIDTAGWWRFMGRLMREGRVTKEHVDALQAMWDLMEELKHEAQQVNRSLYGTYFEEIQAQSFETPWGRYKGGYAPAKPDPALNRDLATREGLESIQDAERNFRESMPSAGRGFTKTRNQSTRPLLLDVRLVSGHLDEVLRFVHLQPSLRDVASLLRDGQLAGYLNSVDKTAIQDVLVPWLERTAANRMSKPGQWSSMDGLFNWLRRTTGFAAMFGSLTNAAQQVTGLSNAAVYVPWRHLRGAMWDGWTNGAAERIATLSKFMDQRLNSQVGQLQDDIDLALQPSKWAAVKDWINRNGYFLQRMFQNRVDPIVWQAAFNHSLEQSGATEADADAVAKAVDHADGVVRKSQGSQSPIDVAKYEASTPFARLFTQFSGYFNTVLNQITSQVGASAKAKAAVHALVFPTIVAGAIAAALNGRDDIDDKDGDGYSDEYVAWFFGQQLRAGAALVPGFGPNALKALTSAGLVPGATNPGNRLQMAPAFSTLEALFRTLAAAPRLASGGATPRQVRDFWTALSLSGVPLRQVGNLLTIGAEERR